MNPQQSAACPSFPLVTTPFIRLPNHAISTYGFASRYCVHNIGFKVRHVSSFVEACSVQAAYWTLEKRRDDLQQMPKEWSRILLAFSNTFPDPFSRQSVQVDLLRQCISSIGRHQ